MTFLIVFIIGSFLEAGCTEASRVLFAFSSDERVPAFAAFQHWRSAIDEQDAISTE
jgi:hypothetical protein